MRAADSFVITEDHYIDYLAQDNLPKLIPVYLKAMDRTSHFLFLGYGMRDWNLRVILRHIWSEQSRALLGGQRAIQLAPGEIEQRFWARRGSRHHRRPARGVGRRDARRARVPAVRPRSRADAHALAVLGSRRRTERRTRTGSSAAREGTEIDHRQPPRLPAHDPVRRERRRQELRPARGRRCRVLRAEPDATRGRSRARVVTSRSWSSEQRGRSAGWGRRPAGGRAHRPGVARPAAATTAVGLDETSSPTVGDADRRPGAGRPRPVRGVLPLPPARGRPGLLPGRAAAAARRRDRRSNFILSIREDALAQLDRFEARVPGLLGEPAPRSTTSTGRPRRRRSNGRSSSGTASVGPAEAVEIEAALVDAVLDQVETGKVQLGDGVAAPARSPDGGEGRIEAPYLQLVLSRLWAEERSLGSRLLRLQTLERLGGAGGSCAPTSTAMAGSPTASRMSPPKPSATS